MRAVLLDRDHAAKKVGSPDRRGLGVVAAVGLALVFLLALPVATGLFLGALLAATLRPWCDALRRRTRRPALAAAVCAAGSCALASAGLGTTGYLLVSRGARLASKLPAVFAKGGALERIHDENFRRLDFLGLRPEEFRAHLGELTGKVGAHAAEFAGLAATSFFRLLLAVFFMSLTTYALLRHAGRVAPAVEAVSPLSPAHTRALLGEAETIGRGVVLGTLVVGLVQGLLAGVGYWIGGAPQPAFLGAMTAAASTLPALGTVFVWVSVAVYLLASGHVAGGIVVLAWGAFVVVGLCDLVLRPRVVGRGGGAGLVPTLIGFFGGLSLFGFIGLLLGPFLVGWGTAAVRLYARERRAAG